MKRRTLFAGASLLALAGLAGCTSQAQSTAVNDLVAAVNGVAVSLPQIVVADPLLKAKLQPVIDQLPAVQAALKTLQDNVNAAATATAIVQVEAWLNTAVNTAASIPLIPPPYSLVIQAAAVILPVIEAQLTPLLVPTKAASARPTPAVAMLRLGMTVPQARAVLANGVQ